MRVFDWPSTLFPESPSCPGLLYIRWFEEIYGTSFYYSGQDVKNGKNVCVKISGCVNIFVITYLIKCCHFSGYGYGRGITHRELITLQKNSCST